MINNKKTIIKLVIIASIMLLILPAQNINAECKNSCVDIDSGKTYCVEWLSNVMYEGLIIPCNCIAETGTPCKITDMVQIIINITQLILAVVGSLALVMFIYGGILWIFSQGKEEYITKGKDTLKNAAIGILIVFATWIIINFVIIALKGDTEIDWTKPAEIFGQSWDIKSQ